MKLRKFGAIAIIAALFVGVFASCSKDPDASAPKIRVEKDGGGEITDLKPEYFGTTATSGLRVIVKPGSEDVKIKKDLEVTGKHLSGSISKDPIKIKLKEEKNGEYACYVTLKDLGYSVDNAADIQSLTFVAIDDNAKTGELTLSTAPVATGEMTPGGTVALNHPYGKGKPGYKFSTRESVALDKIGESEICNKSEQNKAFSKTITSEKGLTFGVVQGINFATAKASEIKDKATEATSTTLEVKANDIVIAKDGDKLYLLKIEVVKSDKNYVYDQTGQPSEVDAAKKEHNGYIKFQWKAAQ